MARLSPLPLLLAALSAGLPATLPSQDPGPSVVRTGDPYKRGLTDDDFPRIRELARGVYSYEQLRSAGQERFTTVSLFVVTSEGVLVADGQGNPEETRRLVEEIGRITEQPITHVVICSDHGDHTGGNASFPDDAAYLAHPTSAAVLEGSGRGRRGNPRPVRLPTELVEEKTTLQLGGREIQILFLGRAHTGGDLMVYLPAEKILFMSEAFLHRIFPAMRSAYPSEWVAVIDRALAMDVEVYVPGHGFVDSPEILREELVTYRDALVQVIGEATRLHTAGVSAEDAPDQADFGDLETWTLRSSQGATAIRRVYMELNGELPDLAQRAHDPTIDRYWEMVREAYSGDRALEVVAFVAPGWRLPGNSGFDASIHRVAEVLQRAGYVKEEDADRDAVLTYRIESRAMRGPTWEPVDASLTIVGEDEPLLELASNRNMLAINSFSTPEEGVDAELVHVERSLEGVDVAGKIVFAETGMRGVLSEALDKGAVGVLGYGLAGYTEPETHTDSIQFTRMTLDETRKPWGIMLSYAARERLLAALAEGPVRLRVKTETRIYDSEELTLVADVRGSEVPEERFVFSAHVQEPGANDNASGVGALAEVARATAQLVKEGKIRPRRSITFLWGDEIRSTQRYIADDPERASGILWGLSLDMVGEDTAKTGGTFLIEKMPDPSAIWTRGEDRHTEWGGRPMSEDEMTPHYFNDFTLGRCLDQAELTGWVVRTNPFEGGSDHTPFLRAGKPGLLFWHFTDVYYHTDGDLIDKVSPVTLENAGVSALVSALTLASADGVVARFIAQETRQAAMERLHGELALSLQAIRNGGDPSGERRILETWTGWYAKAIEATAEIEVGGSSAETRAAIAAAAESIAAEGRRLVGQLDR